MVRVLLALALALFAVAASARAEPFGGPFVLHDGLTFYFVNPTGAAFDLTVRWRDPHRDHFPRPTMVRVFDPEERLLARHEFPGEPVQPPPWEEVQVPVKASGRGVYQVIVHGWDDGEVQVETRPALQFGVFGHLQWLGGRRDQFADAYVYLPPKLKKLNVTAAGQLESLVLSDRGAEKLRLGGQKMEGEVELPTAGEHVWQLSARGDDYRLDFKGVPIILCPSPQVAKAIHASVDVMPDGTLCFHKHQVAAWKLLQEYKQRPASDYAVELQPLEPLIPAFLKEPGRNQLLFGHYGVYSLLKPILAEQCLEPKSPWFGGILNWRDKAGQPMTENPLADYNRLGGEELAALNKDLAAMYWMKADWNPYYHDPKLLHRIIIGVLLDQMIMKEGEYCYATNIYYYGNHGFTLCHSHSGAFSLIYRDMPPDVQAIWHAGQQRLTDRMLYGDVGGCTNQWTVLLAGLWRYYEGTGEEWYKQAVLRNAHWITSATLWNTGQRAAGYMTEALGPDATYNGITGHYFSYLYHRSQDPELLESLRKCYGLFNHTITVEPDGSWLGSSGFCHRTPGDWTGPQYGAGLGPMAEFLPEAGVRMPDHMAWATAAPVFDDASRTAAETQLKKMIAYFPEDHFSREAPNAARAVGAFDIMFNAWQISTGKFVPGKLPCQESDSFTRNFGNEFLCVKRPAYYAFLFGARDYELWQKDTRPKVYNEQMPHNDGLCLFWSPGFGVSLLSKNWGAAQGNTILVDRLRASEVGAADAKPVDLGGGRIEWPWYWDTQCELDAEHATAKLKGRINQTPLRYQRTYRFLEDRIECELTVTAAEAASFTSVSECLPYPTPDAKPGGLEAKLVGADGVAVETAPTKAAPTKGIYFTNKSGQGHLVVLDQPLPVNLGTDHSVDHYEGQHDWGRALISLPAKWAAGDTFTLKYALRPCAAAEVPNPLR